MNKKRTKAAGELVVERRPPPTPAKRKEAPPILLGRNTHQVRRSFDDFVAAVADILERWVTRRDSPHTQRAYRQDVMALVGFLGLAWLADAGELLTVSVTDVQDWRDAMLAAEAAPKTMNRRISSVSSFYKYLGVVVGEMRMPITIPNPAIARRLTADGFRSPKSDHVLTDTVRKIRRKHEIFEHANSLSAHLEMNFCAARPAPVWPRRRTTLIPA